MNEAVTAADLISKITEAVDGDLQREVLLVNNLGHTWTIRKATRNSRGATVIWMGPAMVSRPRV